MEWWRILYNSWMLFKNHTLQRNIFHILILSEQCYSSAALPVMLVKPFHPFCQHPWEATCQPYENPESMSPTEQHPVSPVWHHHIWCTAGEWIRKGEQPQGQRAADAGVTPPYQPLGMNNIHSRHKTDILWACPLRPPCTHTYMQNKIQGYHTTCIY